MDLPKRAAYEKIFLGIADEAAPSVKNIVAGQRVIREGGSLFLIRRKEVDLRQFTSLY